MAIKKVTVTEVAASKTAVRKVVASRAAVSKAVAPVARITDYIHLHFKLGQHEKTDRHEAAGSRIRLGNNIETRIIALNGRIPVPNPPKRDELFVHVDSIDIPDTNISCDVQIRFRSR